MKGMTRNFSRKEKILIVLLLLVLLFLAYKQFVDKPINKSLEEERSAQSTLRNDIDKVNEKIEVLEQMEKEIAEFKNSGEIILMPTYNASQKERNFLSNVLKTTKGASVTISDCTRNGNQIRRQMTVSFTTSTYKEMEWFLSKVNDCPYRCVINKASCTIGRKRNAEGTMESTVTANLTFTFFETLVGGTPDAALPADKPTG